MSDFPGIDKMNPEGITKQREKEDKEFELRACELRLQCDARKGLAEFMQAHNLYFRQSADALEIVMVTVDGLERIIYTSSAEKIFPLDMVNTSLDDVGY